MDGGVTAAIVVVVIAGFPGFDPKEITKNLCYVVVLNVMLKFF